MGAALPYELGEDRLDELLGMWSRWMHANPVKDLQFPDTACGCVGGGYSQSFDDMVEAAEARVVEAVDGAIESLEAIEQCAIYHVHLYAVFRFRGDVEEIYRKARGALRAALPSRGVY